MKKKTGVKPVQRGLFNIAAPMAAFAMALTVACFQSAPMALADDTVAQPTTGLRVAMVFHRLAGAAPDFSVWAAAEDAALDVNGLRHAFQLLTLEEPLVVEHKARLLTDSALPGGFLVEGLGPDTFYSFSFSDRRYALVPLDAGDYQWLAVPEEEKREEILRARDPAGYATLRFHIMPEQADAQAPMTFGETDYWLLSGRIRRIQILPRSGGAVPVWEVLSREEQARQRRDLLDLYR